MTIPETGSIAYNLEQEIFRVTKISFNAPVPRHKHSCYELFFILDGEGTFHMDCQHYDIKSKSLFLVAPGQLHGWEYSNHLSAYLLKFDLSIFTDQSFIDHLTVFNFDTVTVSDDEFKQIEGVLSELNEEYLCNKSFKECSINNLLNILLIYVQRTLSSNTISYTSHTLFAKLNDLMLGNNYKIAQPSCYAKKLKVNVKLLNETVRAITHLSCGEFIRSKTIEEAKRLLKYNPMTCNEIADYLGFIDPAYFSRFFKREVGISPKNFRDTSS